MGSSDIRPLDSRFQPGHEKDFGLARRLLEHYIDTEAVVDALKDITSRAVSCVQRNGPGAMEITAIGACVLAVLGGVVVGGYVLCREGMEYADERFEALRASDSTRPTIPLGLNANFAVNLRDAINQAEGNCANGGIVNAETKERRYKAAHDQGLKDASSWTCYDGKLKGYTAVLSGLNQFRVVNKDAKHDDLSMTFRIDPLLHNPETVTVPFDGSSLVVTEINPREGHLVVSER